MDLLIAPNSVPLARADGAPMTGTPQYATDGNPSVSPAVPPTQWPAYAFNGIQAELINLIALSGQTPDRFDLQQVAQAVLLISLRRSLYNPGNYNFTVPGGVTLIRVRMWGGGGGGGGAASGGAGGGGGGAGYAEGTLVVTPGQVLPLAVGLGGAGGAIGVAGAVGGTTAIGNVSASGGGAGAGASQNTFGAGSNIVGIGTNASIYQTDGFTGGPGAINVCGGFGGGAEFASGATIPPFVSGSGTPGGLGAGGSGAINGYAGGAGGGGLMYIEF